MITLSRVQRALQLSKHLQGTFSVLNCKCSTLIHKLGIYYFVFKAFPDSVQVWKKMGPVTFDAYPIQSEKVGYAYTFSQIELVKKMCLILVRSCRKKQSRYDV